MIRRCAVHIPKYLRQGRVIVYRAVSYV